MNGYCGEQHLITTGDSRHRRREDEPSSSSQLQLVANIVAKTNERFHFFTPPRLYGLTVSRGRAGQSTFLCSVVCGTAFAGIFSSLFVAERDRLLLTETLNMTHFLELWNKQDRRASRWPRRANAAGYSVFDGVSGEEQGEQVDLSPGGPGRTAAWPSCTESDR